MTMYQRFIMILLYTYILQQLGSVFSFEQIPLVNRYSILIVKNLENEIQQ